MTGFCPCVLHRGLHRALLMQWHSDVLNCDYMIFHQMWKVWTHVHARCVFCVWMGFLLHAGSGTLSQITMAGSCRWTGVSLQLARFTFLRWAWRTDRWVSNLCSASDSIQTPCSNSSSVSVLQQMESVNLELSDDEDLREQMDLHSIIVSCISEEPLLTAEQVRTEPHSSFKELYNQNNQKNIGQACTDPKPLNCIWLFKK